MNFICEETGRACQYAQWDGKCENTYCVMQSDDFGIEELDLFDMLDEDEEI